jgi:hypothetical protein
MPATVSVQVDVVPATPAKAAEAQPPVSVIVPQAPASSVNAAATLETTGATAPKTDVTVDPNAGQ